MSNIVPKFIFTDDEKLFIHENLSHKDCKVYIGNTSVVCYDFAESEDKVLDELFYNDLSEVAKTKDDPEKRAFATRISVVGFQAVRDLAAIRGGNLIDIAKAVKAVGKLCALAMCVAVANLDMVIARRLLPIIRAI